MSAPTSADTYTKMRTIKFRAWSDETKQMIENVAVKDGHQVIPVQTSGQDSWDAKFESYDNELMQFTGLKDRHGKEIYEGDILKINFSAYVPNTDHIVKWDEGFCRFVGEVIERNPHSEYHQDRLYVFHPSTNCEVIGNVWESPELLVPTPIQK